MIADQYGMLMVRGLDEDFGEGEVIFSAKFFQYDGLAQLDILRDWLEVIHSYYNETWEEVFEDFPNAGVGIMADKHLFCCPVCCRRYCPSDETFYDEEYDQDICKGCKKNLDKERRAEQ